MPEDLSSLGDARRQVATVVGEVVAEPGMFAGAVTVVEATPGIGKTSTVLSALSGSSVRAAFTLPTLALAGEVIAEAARRGLRGSYVEGHNEANCRRIDVVRRLREQWLPIASFACGTKDSPRCPYRTGCTWWAQFEDNAQVIVGSTDQLFNPSFLSGRELIIVDDPRPAAFLDEERFSLEDLPSPEETPRGSLRRLVEVVRAALKRAEDGHLTGAEVWDGLWRAARREGRDLSDLIRGSGTALRMKPDAAADLDTILAQPWQRLRPLAQVLGEELPAFLSGRDFNSYLSYNACAIALTRPRALPPRRGLGQATILWLDATPNWPLLRSIIGTRKLRHHVVAVLSAPGVQLTQDLRLRTAKTSMRKPENLRQVQRALTTISNGPGPSDGVIVYTEQREAMVDTGFLTKNIETWGRARGTNRLEHVDRLFVVGRPQPPLREVIWPLAEALFHDDEKPIDGDLGYAWRRFEGQEWEGNFLSFEDARAEEVLKAHREAEVYQAVHRARLVSRTTPLEVHLLEPIPIPGLRIEKLEFDDTRPSENERRHQDAFARIDVAIAELKSEGVRPSQRLVCQRAKVSAATYTKYTKTKRKENRGQGMPPRDCD